MKTGAEGWLLHTELAAASTGRNSGHNGEENNSCRTKGNGVADGRTLLACRQRHQHMNDI